jgi:hypothetical protein
MADWEVKTEESETYHEILKTAGQTCIWRVLKVLLDLEI